MLSNIAQTKQRKISYEGLKENLRLGEQVLKEFKREFPRHIRSGTFLEIKIAQHSGKDKFERSALPKARPIAQRYLNERTNAIKSLNLNPHSFDDFISELKTSMKTKRFANCHEHAFVAKHNLLKKGEDPHIISINILDIQTNKYKDKYSSYHIFTVFGLKKDAQFNKPETWGQEAVVVDTWGGNIVSKAQDAIEHFKIILGFNPAKHKVKYKLTKIPQIEK